MISPEEKVIEVLKRKLNNSTVKINDEKVQPGIAFSDLKKETGLSKAALIESLEKLQKANLIHRSNNGILYYITE